MISKSLGLKGASLQEKISAKSLNRKNQCSEKKMEKIIFGIICLLLALTVLRSEAKKPKEKPDWAKKSVRDYT